MVNAALECALGRGTQGGGVRDVRTFSLAVGLTAALTLTNIAPGFAGSIGMSSSDHRAQQSDQASYRANASTPVSHAGGTPPNCVREACGRLWCWHMKGQTTSKNQ